MSDTKKQFATMLEDNRRQQRTLVGKLVFAGFDEKTLHQANAKYDEYLDLLKKACPEEV